MAQCSLRFQLNFPLGILALLKKENVLAPVSLRRPRMSVF